MAIKPVITPEKRAEVLTLHGEGLGRNEIAKRAGVGAATVTKIVTEAGLSFDRSTTAAATEARRVDLKLSMVELAEQILADTHRLRKQLWEPTKVINFGGRNNTLAETTIPEPLFVDKKNIMAAVTMGFDRVLRMHVMNDDHGVDTAKSMLAGLGEQLGLPDD